MGTDRCTNSCEQTLGDALPMHKYNGSSTIPKGLSLCARILLCLGLAACTATTSPPATDESANTRQPDVQQVSDGALRNAVDNSVPLRYVVKPGDTLWDIADYF